MGGQCLMVLSADRRRGSIGVDTLQNAEFKIEEERSKGYEEFETNFRRLWVACLAPCSKQRRSGLKSGRRQGQPPRTRRWPLGLMRAPHAAPRYAHALQRSQSPRRCINSAGGLTEYFRPTDAAPNKKYADFKVVTIDDVGQLPPREKPGS